jgi:hypothetical protein
LSHGVSTPQCWRVVLGIAFYSQEDFLGQVIYRLFVGTDPGHPCGLQPQLRTFAAQFCSMYHLLKKHMLVMLHGLCTSELLHPQASSCCSSYATIGTGQVPAASQLPARSMPASCQVLTRCLSAPWQVPSVASQMLHRCLPGAHQVSVRCLSGELAEVLDRCVARGRPDAGQVLAWCPRAAQVISATRSSMTKQAIGATLATPTAVLLTHLLLGRVFGD